MGTGSGRGTGVGGERGAPPLTLRPSLSGPFPCQPSLPRSGCHREGDEGRGWRGGGDSGMGTGSYRPHEGRVAGGDSGTGSGTDRGGARDPAAAAFAGGSERERRACEGAGARGDG